ncbi:MAG: leucine-rich repeat domain-containing protein, partial [Porcipelethomonas sp.]
MTKKIKKPIAFMSAVTMAASMLLNFPSGFFSNIDWNLTASAAEGDVAINATNFPDAKFRNYIIDNLNTDDDENTLSAEEIAAVTEIDVLNMGISDLKGIEYFTALTKLQCSTNSLKSLDVSQNTLLTELYCNNNSLTSLDVSKNTALKLLYCNNNSLTSLDVSQNTALTELWCTSNQLTSLDSGNNTALTKLYCGSNKLTSLDVSKNTELTLLSCANNSLTSLDLSQNTELTDLYCNYNPLIAVNAASTISKYFGASSLSAFEAKSPVIRLADYGIKEAMVSDIQGGTIENGYLLVTDDTATYTYDIDGGLGEKTISCTIKAGGIEINKTNFPDAIFREYVKDFDTDNNNKLSGTEIAAVTEINVSSKEISDLKGIEYFTALETLFCNSNSLTSLDVSQNAALKTLYCGNNSLTSLDVSKNTELTLLSCDRNNLTSLDLSKNTALTYLNCNSTGLTSLDVSQNTALTQLSCGLNSLTSLDVSKNTALKELYCYSNQLTGLDVSKNTKLETLSCGNNSLESLDVSKNTALTELKCYSNSLTSLDVSQNTALTKLNCKENPLIAVNAASNISTLDASPLSAFTAKSPVIRLADYGIKEDMV